MDVLHQRYDEVKQADVARNTLIEDLLQKVDGMQKTMDRNSFVMVLIDGDSMPFLDELVKQGMTGGEVAAKLLSNSVSEWLRPDKDFRLDHKIVLRVYANYRGLCKTYVNMSGILPDVNLFNDFVLGFNKAHPLCDFIDAGNHKEAADTKLKEVLGLYVYNVHCKTIIFGGSSDNAYASFLRSFLDTGVSSRIRLLKGPPFSQEFEYIISKFKWKEFKNVFRSESLPTSPWRRSRETAQRNSGSHWNTTNDTTSMPLRPKSRDQHPRNTGSNKGLRASGPDLIELSSPESPNSDHDSDGVGVDVSHEVVGDQSPTSSTAASGNLTPQTRASGRPTTSEVEAALRRCTNRQLEETPLALDFGVVKKMVEQELGLTSDFWGKGEHDKWFSRSKNIIKIAVEEWIVRTNNPPPKNATWILRFFQANGESPESIMRKLWRKRQDPGKVTPPTNHKIVQETGNRFNHQATTGRPNPPTTNHKAIDGLFSDRIFLNSEGRRIDVPTELHAIPSLISFIRGRKTRFCNAHHLIGACHQPYCPFDHDTELTERELEALLSVSRGQRCPQGSLCEVATCTKGHMCPNGQNCNFGSGCKFADLHGMDTVLAREIRG